MSQYKFSIVWKRIYPMNYKKPLKQDVGKFGSLHCPMQLNTFGT